MPNNGYDNTESQNGGAQGAAENQEDLEKGQPANGQDEYPDDPDELKERLRKTEEIRDKNYARMKEAQGFVQDANGKWVKAEKPQPKQTESTPPATQTDDLRGDDVLALMNAQVTEKEDIELVKKAAKLQGVDIRTALKDGVVKGLLADSAEKRRTQNATNTGRTRASDTRPTGEALLDKARKSGEVPESADDMAKIAEAKLMEGR